MSAGIKPNGIGVLAESRGIRECLAFFTREKIWIHEQHVALCRIPAPTFLEQKRAEWMAEQFRALGCEAEIDRAGNVVAWPAARWRRAAGGRHRPPGYRARAAQQGRDRRRWRRHPARPRRFG